MPVAESLDFRIPSDVQYIEEVVGQVVRRCKALAFSRRHVALNVPVALTEALSNAILRGNGEDTSRDVVVRVEIDETRLVAEVRDEGAGFDIAGCTADATLPENVVREDGRGLYLMQQLMDSVEQYSDNGNVVRLVLIRG
ncbi:MAG TPA: ATP-binding protein [Gemmatimonadaceae bacterium]|nr:ATP-binding protein [Gemmatimonadaceae bacterium]